MQNLPLGPTTSAFTALTTLRSHARRALAGGVAIAILITLANVAFAGLPTGSLNSVGIITVSGIVTINETPAISGQTLFSGSTIVTAQHAESTLDLGALTRLKLDANTSLTLAFSRSSLTATLEQGSVRGVIPSGIRAEIVTADVTVASDASQPAVFSVQVESCVTSLIVETGCVEVRTGDDLKLIKAGQSFSTGAGTSIALAPSQNPGNQKRVGLFAGIGAAIAAVLVAMTGRRHESPGNPCPLGLSSNFGSSTVTLSDTTGRLCP